MEIVIKENLKMIKLKDVEFIIFIMEINMKDNLKMVIGKDMEFFIILMEDMKENLKII